jgi:tripartite-type tricarboxylate transporter receptor subunit TctC
MKKSFLMLVLGLLMLNVCSAWQPPSVVRVIVGQGPGGGNEWAFRTISTVLERNNPGTKFIFDHKPGLDSVVAMNHFAEQKPDGSSIIVIVQATGFVAAPIAHRSQLQADPMRFGFVSTLAKSPLALVVPSNSKLQTVPDLIAYLKNEKNTVNIGISGGINLLAYHYLLEKLTVSPQRVQAIRFNSPTENSVAAASGTVDISIVPMSVPKTLIDAGRVRLLAHTGFGPIAGAESVPLVKDHVLGLSIDNAWSVFLPPGTPGEIVKWYSETIVQALQDSEVKRTYENNWAVIDRSTLGTAGLANSIESLRKNWLPTAVRVLANENQGK